MATQTLTFSKVGEAYEATFEVTGDFALHIERNEAGGLIMEQSSVKDAEFALVENFPSRARYMKVLDYSVGGVIVPVTIRLTSATMPTMAVVTTAE